MSYPQLVVELTDGNDTKKVSFNNPSPNPDDSKIRSLGNELADAYGNGLSFVQASYITDSIVATND